MKAKVYVKKLDNVIFSLSKKHKAPKDRILMSLNKDLTFDFYEVSTDESKVLRVLENGVNINDLILKI
jgi:L-ribulose-5-phosphate 3-epimerase UlaE